MEHIILVFNGILYYKGEIVIPYGLNSYADTRVWRVKSNYRKI
jgi:hypothetical protein